MSSNLIIKIKNITKSLALSNEEEITFIIVCSDVLPVLVFFPWFSRTHRNHVIFFNHGLDWLCIVAFGFSVTLLQWLSTISNGACILLKLFFGRDCSNILWLAMAAAVWFLLLYFMSDKTLCFLATWQSSLFVIVLRQSKCRMKIVFFKIYGIYSFEDII